MPKCSHVLWLLVALAAMATAAAPSSGDVAFAVDAYDSVYPLPVGHWTGYVRFAAGVYQKQPTSTATISSRNNTASTERGWAKFDLSMLPDDGVVSGAAVRYWVNQLQTNGASIEFRHMTSDPVAETSASLLWSEITAGAPVSSVKVIPSQTAGFWVTETLDAAGVAAVQAGLAPNWVAIGFNEVQANPGYGAQVTGWNNESYRPRMAITYTVAEDVRAIGAGALSYPLVTGETDTVWARFANNGLSTVFNVSVLGLMDNVPFDSLVIAALAPDAETTVALVAAMPVGPPALRTFAVAAFNPAEANHGNDTARFTDWCYPPGTYQAQGFEDSPQSLPAGWVVRTGDAGVVNWSEFASGQSHSGNGHIRCGYESGLANDDWLISPAVWLDANYVDSLGFFLRTLGSSPGDTLEVWAMTGQQVSNALARLYRGTVGTTSYEEVRVPLDFSNRAICIGFRKVGYSLNQLMIDDVWWSRYQGDDVGVKAIVAPPDTVVEGTPIAPRIVAGNFGTHVATFDVRLTIRRGVQVVYDTTETGMTLVPGDTLVRTFNKLWYAQPRDAFMVTANTILSTDRNSSNDAASSSCAVVAAGLSGWIEETSLNSAPSQREVKDGGWLTYVFGLGRVYAAKGNKTSDFYSYDAAGRTWTGRAGIPPGPRSKSFGKGGMGCTDGTDFIYSVKGNNTFEFWRYDVVGDTWHQLRDIPDGTGVKVKGGDDLVYAGTGPAARVYLLNGTKGQFLSYDPATDNWTRLADAPNPASKWYNGSFLVYDGDRTIYAHKAKFHELWCYDIVTQAWSSTPRSGMPLAGSSGRTKRAKDGSSGAWYDNSIYALKGGNTQEFWQYRAVTDSWVELETIPAFGHTGKKKRVKNGGDIVLADENLYALKGNKTLEFWMYSRSSDDAAPGTARPAVMAAGGLSTDDCRLTIAPNPLVGSRALHLTAGAPGFLGTVSLYDAAGRRVLVRSLGYSTTGTLALPDLSPGVYLLRLDAAGRSVTRQIVLTR